MREGVWCWALGAPKSPCGAGDCGVQSKALKELLHLPLRPEENSHLIHFLSHPPKSISPLALSLLHDLITLRLIHQGQYAESLQLDKELAGSGGKEEDRQRRREMVREFITILPEAQRRALLIESELTALRKDEERSKMANGYAEPSMEDVAMGGSWIDVDGPAETGTKSIAPTPIRAPNSLLNIAQNAPLPTSPAPLPRARNDSPFTGPPLFASSSAPAAPTLRVLSGSPFTLPKNASASSSRSLMPKPPKQIINDDANPVDPSMKRSVRGRSRRVSSLSKDAEQEEAIPLRPEQTSATRRSNRRVSSSQKSVPPKEPTPPPSPPSNNTRTRQKTAPPTMPGAFAPEEEVIPEDEAAPPASQNASSSTQESKSRPTRNAKQATLDDEDGPTLAAKRTKSNTGTRARKGRNSVATSEVTDDGGVGVRRSTRRAGTAQSSERGSPTPSVMSNVGGRSEAGRRKRVLGSQTPRMTTRSRRG